MNNTFLHIAIDPDSNINQPALTESLRPYQYIEFFNNSYLIATDQAPDMVVEHLKRALGDTDVFALAFHADQLDDAVLPDDVQTWIADRKAA